MPNYVICGMLFGDCGKGSWVDYLTYVKEIQNIVRYNGGAQAAHTVIRPEDKMPHKFGQMGSGMFNHNAKTYITKNMIADPIRLIDEAVKFGKKTGLDTTEVLSRIFIDQDSYFVTSYHKLLNKLRELSLGNERRGSVGAGVSEAALLIRQMNLGIQIKELYRPLVFRERLYRLFEFTQEFFEENKKSIVANMMGEDFKPLKDEIEFLMKPDSVSEVYNYYLTVIGSNDLNICSDFTKYLKNQSAIYEATQGLLLDWKYGTVPNVTQLDTTNHFAIEMISSFKKKPVKIGIVKAFSTRHGRGVFPTEDGNMVLSDPNQVEGVWNGSMRFGWFDALLTRYAQKINQTDELFLSSLDNLDFFSKIKICNEYLYNGKIDEEFKNIFHYEMHKGKIIIKDIKKTSGSSHLTSYLINCEPIYTEVNGWNLNTSRLKKPTDLPLYCRKYIEMMQNLVGVKISAVSVGPTRSDKIRMC